MKLNYKTSISIVLIALISGCSGKSFTMQEYADKWFNDKHPETKEEKAVDKEQEKAVEKVEKKRESIVESKSINSEEEIETQSTKDETTKTIIKETPKKDIQVEKVVEKKQEIIEPKAKEEINPGKSAVGSSIAPSSVNKRDKHMEGKGAMQSGLDTWTKEEWEPAFKDDKEQKAKDENASHHFTMQHYLDKYYKYSDAEKEKWKKSGKKKPEANYEKMNKMPVIGK